MLFEPYFPIQSEFQKACPILASLTVHLGGVWPDYAAPLLKAVIEKCRLPFENIIPTPDIPAEPTYLQFWQEGHWYPFWPRIRQARKYSRYYTTLSTAEGTNFIIIFKQW